MFDIIIPQLLNAATDIVVPVALAAIAALYYRVTGARLDAEARTALHSALRTGALTVVNTDMTQEQKVALILAYVREGAPGALARFEPLKGTLTTLALSKLEELSGVPEDVLSGVPEDVMNMVGDTADD